MNSIPQLIVAAAFFAVIGVVAYFQMKEPSQ